MTHSQELLDLSPIGARFFVKKTAQHTQGESLDMEWELFPKSGGTPIHIHPHAAETYKVLSGALEIYVDGQWMLLREGETYTVEKNVPHTFRNPTEQLTCVYNIHQLALQFHEYFKGLQQIVHQLSDGGKKKLGLNFKTAMHLSMLMKKHRQEIISVTPLPR